MKKYKIKKIEYGPDIDRTRIYGWSHYKRLRRLYDPEKKYTPGWEDLKEYGPIDQLWFLKSPTWHTIHFKNGGWIQEKFLPGFIWDGASDPIFKEWIQEVRAAMFHDKNFSLHTLFSKDDNKGFRVTNKIFFQFIYYAIEHSEFGYSKFRKAMLKLKARFHYRVVNGVIGRARYANSSVKRRPNHSKTTKFTCSRKGEWM